MMFHEAYLVFFSLLLPSPLLVGAGTTTPATTRQLSWAFQQKVVDLIPSPHDAMVLNNGTRAGRGIMMMEAQEGFEEE
jgi:hypothetical protein